MTSDRRHRSRRRPRSRGQALVEFAVVLPVFILVLSGVLDFGFMLYSRMTVISATREGARAGATADPPTTVDSVVRGAVSNAATGLVASNITVTLACVPAAAGSCTWAPGSPTGKVGDSLKVTVNYQYKTFFPLLFGSTFNLASTVQMVHE